MRKSNRERLADQKRAKQAAQHMSIEDMIKLMLDEKQRPAAKRTINPTQAAVIESKEEVNYYKGPAGCAKTSTIVAAVMARMIMEPGSKGLIARQDFNDLKGTTLLRAESMLSRLPEGTLLDRDKASPSIWWIKPIPFKRRDGSWDDRPSELRFMGLKQGLGSYEFNVAAIDEADEIDKSSLDNLLHRMRIVSAAFYDELPDKPTEEDPDGKDTTGYYNIYLAFNPPDKVHWLYTDCTGRDHKDQKVKEPRGKLFEPNPRENVRNLRSGYYESLTEKLPPDQKQRFVDGEWGATFPGKPAVPTFVKSKHAIFTLDFDPDGTLFRFWDFGFRHPFCLWAQAKESGELFILREEMGHMVEITAFARRIKAFTARHYPGADRIQDIGDIAVKQKKDTGSALGRLFKEGITMLYQHQSIQKGLDLMRKEFERFPGGDPLIKIDKRHCPILISALAGGYHMDEEKGNEPIKDGFYDHAVDTLRYGVVGVLEPMNLKTDKTQDETSAAYTRENDSEFNNKARGDEWIRQQLSRR